MAAGYEQAGMPLDGWAPNVVPSHRVLGEAPSAFCHHLELA